MPTLRFRRIWDLGLLAQVSRRLLVELLAPHEDALPTGILIPPEAGSEVKVDLSALRDFLTSKPEEVPVRLIEAMTAVDSLSTTSAMERLIAKMELHAYDPDGVLGTSPSDVALYAWLRHFAVAERVYQEQLIESRRHYHCFIPVKIKKGFSSAVENFNPAALERVLSPRLAELGRPNWCEVRRVRRDDGCWLFVGRGDPCRREGKHVRNGDESVVYLPRVYDLIQIRSGSGELSINCGTSKSVRNFYREQLGQLLFGDLSFWATSSPKYTLEPLCKDPIQCLKYKDIDGICAVTLTSMSFAGDPTYGERVIHSAKDLLAITGGGILNRDRPMQASSAKFLVKFRNGARKRVVTVRPPNEVVYTHDDDVDPIDEWLHARGLATRRQGVR